MLIGALLIASHAPLLHLPYFWDEAGYYVPAARDLLAGSLIPHSTPSNAHPPLIMGWIALGWRIFGERMLVTRIAMLLLAAFSLLGFFRLALAVSNVTVAVCASVLTATYPVFFAQSSLAQVDLPASGLIFWGLEAYLRKRLVAAAVWLSFAALAKETAILAPAALILWELIRPLLPLHFSGRNTEYAPSSENSRSLEDVRKSSALSRLRLWALLLPFITLFTWYGYHRLRTGFIFGNPEFLRYNALATLHPVRILLALLLRLWQAAGYMNLYVLTVACGVAMLFPALRDTDGERRRIQVGVQLQFLSVIIVYVVALSILGGAVLARYMLPVVPLVILICVSTIWRRLRIWKIALSIIGLAFVTAWFVNPPYGFAPEDNLAYRDYIHLHQRAEAWLEVHYPNARVLTAWPASGELTQPQLGYVPRAMQIVQIEDFTAEQLLSAADVSSQFDVALTFSTKYEVHSAFDRWRQWQEWKYRYFGFHRDMSPQAAALVLGGKIVYADEKQGQWVAVIELQRFQEAVIQSGERAATEFRDLD